ncbi:MAG: gamma-glutamyltransferase [Bacteroidales bacterium]
MEKVILFAIVASILFSCSSPGKNFIEGRDIITGNGMVVSAHPRSSSAGAGILMEGGNAIDAGVATEFALAVCYPEAGNIGGGGFWVIKTHDGNYLMIDYREKAPSMSMRDMFLDSVGSVIGGMSTGSHLASGVPGTVDGMLEIHEKFGKLPFRKVIQPAIDLARNGFPVTAGGAASLNANRDKFIERNLRTPAFVKDTPWKEGDTLRQPELAETLERIRDHGRDGFYSGKTAGLIVREMERGGGIISYHDLNDYKAVFREPLSADYKDYRITTVSPPSGGGIILIQLLRMAEPYPLGEWGFHSVKTIHLIAEAERRAFADRSLHHGDPDYMEVPVDLLLKKEYNASRMKSFNENRASLSGSIEPGNPLTAEKEETTHYSVVDAQGNAVAATTTLNGTFGSSIIVDGAGFLLNNQMDDFSLKPGFPNMYGLQGGEVNAVGPGKRMLSSMTPAIVEKNGELFLVLGSPGGSTIPTTVFQVLINIAEFGMSISDAVAAGRFHHQWLPDCIYHEKERFDSLTLLVLSQMGHVFTERSSIGRVNAIQILPDGRRAAGADPRGDNTACGY